MKKLFFFLFISSSFLLFSKESSKNTYSQLFRPGYDLDCDIMACGYNAPARYKICDMWDAFVSASFIYYQPKEQGLDIGFIVPKTDITVTQSKVINTKFNYEPGFKFTLGSYFGDDNWSSFLNYTRLYLTESAKRNATPATANIDNFWNISNTLTDQDQIKSKWKLAFNLLDLNLGRPFYVGTDLTFHPYIGLRSGWQTQKMFVDSHTLAGENFRTYGKAKSWFLGPKTGLETNWLLADGFRFFGSFSTAIFFQKFDVKLNEFNKASPSTLETDANITKKYFNPSIDFSFGFGWGKYFASNGAHIDITAGYEFLILFNQNVLRSFVETLKNNSTLKPGNFSPHGFFAGLRFDF